jgi:hypothetical protein
MMVYEHTVPLWLIVAGIAAALGAAGWSFVRFVPRRGATVGLAAVHLLTVLLLGWCLLLPGWKTALTRLLKPRFVVVLDTSASMALAPREEAPTRWAAAAEALALPWADVVAAACDLDIVPFSTDTGEPLDRDTALALQPDGQETRLRAALEAVESRYAGLPVAGILVLSDGLDTREAYGAWASEARRGPLFTVRLEPDAAWTEEPDVRVDTVHTARRVTVGWRTELKAVVSGQGTAGRVLAVGLARDGAPLDEIPLTLPAEGGAREARFTLEHPALGTYTYTVTAPPLPGETRTNDNQFAVSVQVVSARNQLLYVEGPPRWESKYLSRVLRAHPDVAPVIFLRGPDGRFMTFGERGGATPDMDEAELAAFKIVMLGNLSAEELGETRARTLVRFVENGGSLILFGGPRAWGADGFEGTALRDLLPVRQVGGEAAAGAYPVAVTDSGRAHPAFAGDAALWQQLPALLTLFPGGRPTPGAQVLVTAGTAGGAQPVIVTQRYGQGRVAAVLTDSLWKWQLNAAAAEERPYARFWNQLLAWMTPEEEELERRPLELAADRAELFLRQTVALSARLDVPAGAQPDTVTCIVRGPDGRERPYPMQHGALSAASGESFTGYACSVTALEAGLHQAYAMMEYAGRVMQSDPVSFFVKPFTPESAPRPVNTDVLQALAASGSGRYCETPAALDAALRELDMDSLEAETSAYRSLWQHGAMIGALMGLCIAGWAIRKGLNMP